MRSCLPDWRYCWESKKINEAKTIARGIYVYQLERWFSFYPRHRIFIGDSRELFENESHFYQTLFEFLGVKPIEIQDVEHRRKNRARYSEIPSDMKTKLDAFYQPYNNMLYDLLGYSFNW